MLATRFCIAPLPGPFASKARTPVTHHVLPARIWFRDGRRVREEHKIVLLGTEPPSGQAGWYDGTCPGLDHGVLTTFDDGSTAWAFERLWSRQSAELAARDLRTGSAIDPAR